ncbi:MAG: chromosomal replication initiator protein DnaA [Patescibacteria group bacterium]
MDLNELWQKTLVDIENNISKASFGTWFKNTSIEKIEDNIIFLKTPNTFVKDWLFNKYHKLILKSLRNHSQDIRNIEYLIGKTDTQKQEVKIKKEEPEKTFNNLGLNDLYINRESNLNPKYTFESFVVGSFNEVAFAAAQAVLKNLGVNYNPLYIYGTTGVGKTHLIQSIGNKIKELNQEKQIYYLTSENFTNDYIKSVQNNKINIFKEKYRKYDLLIMDDIQFFSKKEKTQEELFHLFNSLYDNNKQIIFSSDKPPKYITNLEERLRSRFEGGMIVDIGRPDYESRVAIIKTKIKDKNHLINDDVVNYLAECVQDNIREIEGTLNSIFFQAQAKKRPLSLNEVKNLIKDSIKPKKVISYKEVLKVVSEYYNINEKIIQEKTRKKEVVKPRQIIMYILREDFNTSYPYIGQQLGGRDHTTVIHACEKIKKEIKDNNNLNREIEEIRDIIYKEN